MKITLTEHHRLLLDLHHWITCKVMSTQFRIRNEPKYILSPKGKHLIGNPNYVPENKRKKFKTFDYISKNQLRARLQEAGYRISNRKSYVVGSRSRSISSSSSSQKT